MLPAVKTENFFSPIFSDFCLAVSASENDTNYRRPNSFITLMTRDMDRAGSIFRSISRVMGVINEFGLR